MDAENLALNDPSADDLSALAWVHGELRRSLETAHKSLRRYLKEAESASGGDLDTIDPSLLRSARSQLHQGVGALELVGLPAVADVLRASEVAVQRLMAKPALVNTAAVEVIERVSFALLDFLTRQLARKPVSPVMLFPQYRAALQLGGADRVHPADLWKIDWQWLELPSDTRARPRAADDEARSAMESEVLSLMREPGRAGLARMSDLCAELGAGARQPTGGAQLGTLWQLAAAVFEAQSTGLLDPDVYSKRLASRLLAQLRSTVRGQPEASDRLAQDLLFFCSHARQPSAPESAPRLHAVRQVWRLQDHPVADYETARLGRFDPSQLLLARKRVAAAKDAWSAVAGGEQHRITGLPEQFALVGESLQRLFPGGEVLAQALQATVAQTVQSGQSPDAPLAMEVATGILYLDASLEDGELDQPELPARVQRLAGRIDSVRLGADPQPLDIWMEELYRRVSDRQTMGSVVQELRASLSEIEKQIDHYFRNPAERNVLIPVPAQLSSMRGVLSVLGMEQASQAALFMRDDVDALTQTEVDPQRAIQTGTFDRLADNLGALSFLIDMLSVQPQLAKSLFRFNPETGLLTAVMGQTERVSAFSQLDEAGAPAATPADAAMPLLAQVQALGAAASRATLSDAELAREADRLSQQALAADQPELARLLGSARAGLQADTDPAARQSLRAELAAAVAGLGAQATEAAAPSAPVPPPTPAPVGGTGLEDDAEMREIFIEEAREVVADATAAVERLQAVPDSTQDMTAVRRAFHTLKGSSRMVGLRDFGEAAWSCEQLFNARLAQSPNMDPQLRQCTSEALAYLESWVEAIAAGRQQGHNVAAVAGAADALRLNGARVPITLPGVAEADADATLILARTEAPVPVAEEPPLPALLPDPVLAAAPAPEPAPAAVEETPALPVIEPALVDAGLAEVGPQADAVPFAEFEPAPELLGEAGRLVETLEAFEPPAAASPVPEPEFALRLGDFDDEPAPRVVPDVQPLTQRLPDLPSAEDLDLGRREPPPPIASVSTPVEDEIAFELDLGDFNEPAQSAVPAQADFDLDLDLPGAALPAVPAAAAEAPQIDLDEWGDIFGPDVEAPTDLPALAGPADAGSQDLADLPLELELELDLDLPAAAAPQAQPPLLREVEEPRADEPEADEQVKVIGPLRISIPLFNIYLNEADELSRRLVAELGEWALDAERHPVSDAAVALAHSLAGSSATVGYADLSALARSLEHALMRSRSSGHGRPGEATLFCDAAEDIRRLLHQFAAGFLRPVNPELVEQLAAHERLPMASAETLADFDPLGAEDAPGYEASQPAQLAAADTRAPAALAEHDGIDAADAIDTELFPIFEEEAEELLPQLQARLRDWHDHPGNAGAPAACMRTLHTFKGGARLAGAMRLGEMAHQLETEVERLSALESVQSAQIDPLLVRSDAMVAAFDALRRRPLAPPPAVELPRAEAAAVLPELAPLPLAEMVPEPMAQVLPAPTDEAPATATPAEATPAVDEVEPAVSIAADAAATAETAEATGTVETVETAETAEAAEGDEAAETGAPAEAAAAPAADAAVAEPVLAAETPAADDVDIAFEPEPASQSATAGALAPIDWSRFSAGTPAPEVQAGPADRAGAGQGAAVRVRAGLLDRLVNNAGEVSITRSRIDSTVRQLQGSLAELTDSLERMRRQLRDIEVQAESQISSRMEAAKAAAQTFDPLEMDRFTRFQELTRFMAESVNDVATLQRSLQRTLQSAEDELAAQARLTRELQDDLLRTRMIEFESMADRLYRTVRQAARDTGKQVRLEIVGGGIEIDRGVLERMAGSFEHLLRNSVAHGVESPAERERLGKSPGGLITVTVAQSGNEVAVDVADDGSGLDLGRIRQRAIERGLLAAETTATDAELSQLIFSPGFSTAETVTELAGRGVGLDVVRAEVNAMGGRIETASDPGKGSRFRLLLPLTTAVTQVVMLRCGETQVAVPSPLVELVRRVPTAEVEQAYVDGHLQYNGEPLPFFWLASLLQAGIRGPDKGRTQSVVIVRSAAQRVAVHVDEVVGNQEVVVKNVGPQLSRLPGLAGVTLLPSGAVALIYNPVALATVYAESLREQARSVAAAAAVVAAQPAVVPEAAVVPMVMVVDDSLTVRRVTQRLLVREGYRVVTAKDGLDALERLAEERPAVLLSDIEMPRMDGFDLVRNVRADPRLRDLPVVMITSRIAQKHRDYAAELGVDHYLGKPYSEEELLGLVAGYVAAQAPAPGAPATPAQATAPVQPAPVTT